MSIQDRFKKHWAVWLASLLLAVIAGTWTAAYQILVEPRDFEIERLRSQIGTATQPPQADALPLPPTWLKENEGAPFLAGRGSVTARGVGHMYAFLRVNLPDGTSHDWNDIDDGGRREFVFDGRKYALYLIGHTTDRVQVAVGTLE